MYNCNWAPSINDVTPVVVMTVGNPLFANSRLKICVINELFIWRNGLFISKKCYRYRGWRSRTQPRRCSWEEWQKDRQPWSQSGSSLPFEGFEQPEIFYKEKGINKIIIMMLNFEQLNKKAITTGSDTSNELSSITCFRPKSISIFHGK